MTFNPPNSPHSVPDVAKGVSKAYEQQIIIDEVKKGIQTIQKSEYGAKEEFRKDMRNWADASNRQSDLIRELLKGFPAIIDKAEPRVQKFIDSFQQKANQITELKVETRSMIATRFWIHTTLFSILSSAVVALVFSIWEPLHIQQKKDVQTWSHFQTKVFPKLDLETQRKITRTWDSSETK